MDKLRENRGRRLRAPAWQSRIAIGRIADQRQIVGDRCGRRARLGPRLPRTHPNPARRAARSSAGTARMYRRPDRRPSTAPTEPYRTGVVLINYLRSALYPLSPRWRGTAHSGCKEIASACGVTRKGLAALV